MHVLQSQRIVRQFRRPIRRISGINGTFPRLTPLGRLAPAWMGSPHLDGALRHTWLRTEHGIGLPLAIHPCLRVDTSRDRRWSRVERDRSVERAGVYPAMTEGWNEGIASEWGCRIGARFHDMSHDCVELLEDMIGGRCERM